VFVKGKTTDVVSTTQPHKREEKEMIVTNIYIRRRKRKRFFLIGRSLSFSLSMIFT
jgi:hypothetical protein